MTNNFRRIIVVDYYVNCAIMWLLGRVQAFKGVVFYDIANKKVPSC